MRATGRLLGSASTTTRARTERSPRSSMRRLILGIDDPSSIGVASRSSVTRGRVARALRSFAPYWVPPAGRGALGAAAASSKPIPPEALPLAASGEADTPPAFAAPAEPVQPTASASSAGTKTWRRRRIHPRVGHRRAQSQGLGGLLQVPPPQARSNLQLAVQHPRHDLQSARFGE